LFYKLIALILLFKNKCVGNSVLYLIMYLLASLAQGLVVSITSFIVLAFTILTNVSVTSVGTDVTWVKLFHGQQQNMWFYITIVSDGVTSA
jgi:hypothetical protein